MNFVRKNDQLYGPFSESQIRSGLKSGKLSLGDEIAESKEGPWLRLSDHPAFQTQASRTSAHSNDLGLDDLLEFEKNAPAKTLAPVNPTAYSSAATGGTPRQTAARGFGTKGDNSDAGQKALDRLADDEREQRQMEEEHKREVATKAIAGIGIAVIGVLLLVGGIVGFLMFMRQNTKDVEAMVQPGIDRWLEDEDEKRNFGVALPDSPEDCERRINEILAEKQTLIDQLSSASETERTRLMQKSVNLQKEADAILKKWEKLDKEAAEKKQRELDSLAN